MPIIQPVLRCEIDPANPVSEICDVISAVMPYHHPGKEEAILRGLTDAIEKRLTEIKKGADQHD